jgi:LCP family protein required for cell wall assembly
MKINAVFATAKQNALYKRQSNADAEKAGFAAIEKKVSEIAGIPIHYHAMVDFTGFSSAIDTVGGVTIDVKKPLYDTVLAAENRGNALIAPKGVQTMNGKKALLYAQSRYGSARGDFDRNQRQREVLVALKDKVFSLGTFGNPVKVAQLIDNFGGHIQSNFSIDEIMRLYNLGKQIDSSQITSVGLADPPQELVTTNLLGGQSVVVPKVGTYDYSAIQHFVRNTLKDGFIRKENPTVIVLNGTSRSGLATAKAEELKSYGYNVVKVDDAPTKNYTNNVLVDMRDGEKKYTKRYLELHLKTTPTKKLPEGINPENADFVIIVGQ